MRRAVQNRWHGAVTVNCWPLRTARGTRRVMNTTATVRQIGVHREEGISTYSSYNPRGQLVSQKDAQGRETRYEYSAAGDLTAYQPRTVTAARHSMMRGVKPSAPRRAV